MKEATEDLTSEIKRAQELAFRYQFDFVDLRESRPDADLLRTLPLDLMVRYQFLPLEAHDHHLVVAVGDPSDLSRLATEAATLQFLLSQYNIPVPAKLPYALEPRLDVLTAPILPNDSPPAQ